MESRLPFKIFSTLTKEVYDNGKMENICKDQTEEVSNVLSFEMTLGMNVWDDFGNNSS